MFLSSSCRYTKLRALWGQEPLRYHAELFDSEASDGRKLMLDDLAISYYINQALDELPLGRKLNIAIWSLFCDLFERFWYFCGASSRCFDFEVVCLMFNFAQTCARFFVAGRCPKHGYLLPWWLRLEVESGLCDEEAPTLLKWHNCRSEGMKRVCRNSRNPQLR